MLAGLCRECHHTVSVQPTCGLATHVQWTAIERATQEFTTPAVLLLDGAAIDAAKYIERHLIDRGEMDQLREVAGI
jgi:hypothetical protein